MKFLKLFGLFLLIVMVVQAFLTTLRLVFFPEIGFWMVLLIECGTGMIVMYSVIKFFDKKEQQNATDQ